MTAPSPPNLPPKLPADLALDRRAGLPEDLRFLLGDYPRLIWGDHPNFGPTTRFYLDRHAMFREAMTVMTRLTDESLDGGKSPDRWSREFGRIAGFFLQQLHGHHQIEDMHYFPVLEQQDARISSGFGILDKDHHQIDALLHGFADAANQLLRDPGTGSAFRDKSGAVKTELDRMAPMLDRHLVDEEELVVPVLLKFKPAGLS